ncbi:hypothetical protein HBI56_059020 [Parastagonospora nodorum]|uniref:Uncharacterized protein n=1 Tax=Phaeosphaeria nodorum (strain SN15 / ATCC MYA-4574 / FGSC 10173) TaxID=321614 RepID=A0A7U2HZ58_PHANO|nr:hypothetical protein HBH56_159620 [Parastagonospora nodorum]QRC97290.1 hypothetical protein JI435_410420 [Parastagonospora nodorum SN15]KAH3922440.1 hypothetical protein HBH54_224050 [Parastagonospora nodorum]KAH3946984.1 hypothetical protein HBH53_122300 [Parastagonospora nodorum]KAH3969732.1 hypothetical protein HBH52_170320 [Parastagonospora nodorum]
MQRLATFSLSSAQRNACSFRVTTMRLPEHLFYCRLSTTYHRKQIGISKALGLYTVSRGFDCDVKALCVAPDALSLPIVGYGLQ